MNTELQDPYPETIFPPDWTFDFAERHLNEDWKERHCENGWLPMINGDWTQCENCSEEC